nr:retrovirus-related Pol polyprotein from transposon TNT 1-94 [Tanacetum cinerariifolium]
MANLSKDIQYANSDTRPPMIYKTDFVSWQQRIRLYCRGKENGVNILKSIDEGPFQMGTVWEPLAEGTEGAPHLGPERPRDKSRNLYKAREHLMTNTSLILRLTTSSNTRNQATVQDDRVVVENVQGRLNRGQWTNPRGGGAAGYRGVQNRVGNANPSQARQVKGYKCNGIGHIARNCTQPKRPQNSDYYKDKMLLMQAQENGVALDEEQLLFLAGGQANAIDEDVNEQPVQDLALNVDNVFQADDCDAFDYDVDEAPTAQTMFMANLEDGVMVVRGRMAARMLRFRTSIRARGRSSGPTLSRLYTCPEEPEQAPPLPDYVPGPEHADDEIVAEDQSYAEDASPAAQSPEYVPESDLEAHPEDDDDEDPEEDPEGSSKDDEDDDMDIEADEEEEEEHPAPADSVVVASIAADQAPSAEETKLFETDESAATPPPHPAYRMTARISIPAPVPMPAWSDSEAASTSHSPPLPPPFILSPTRLDAPSSGTPLLLPISASTSSPPLQLPTASRRENRPEVTLPPRKKLGIALGPGYEVGESSSAAVTRPTGGLRADYGFVATMDREIMCNLEREVGYGITDSWDEIVETLQGAPISTDTELGGYMREFETRVKQDTEEIYMRLDDEQNASDLVRGEVMSLRTTVLGQMTEIKELHATDRRRQIVILEMLRADHRRSTEIIELRTALQG